MTWLDDVEANAAMDGDPDEALARLVAFARAVLALHQSVETWTETIVGEDGEQEDRALYDDNGELVAAMDGIEVVCSECAPRMGQPWPCPTVRALAAEHLGES